MKYLILIGLFFLSFITEAQSKLETGQIAKRVVEVLNERHIQPRELDDNLASSIHENVLSSLDYEKLFFTSEDIAELKEAQSNIVRDLPNELEVYLNKVKKLHSENLEKIKEFHTRFFETQLDLSKKPNGEEIDMDEFADDANFERKWQLLLRSRILEGVLNQLEDQEFEIESDSLEILIDSTKNRVSDLFIEYYKNIEEDNEFINNIYFNAIATAYDPHSNYFSFSQNKAFEEELSSERKLFGVSYIKNTRGELEITQIVPGSSAWLSGEVRVGDIIRKIKFGDGETIDLKGKSRNQLHKLFENDDSDRVVLTLENDNDGIKTVELFKTAVYSDDDIIKSAILNGEKKIGYISLPDFYANWNDDSGLGCANDLAKTLIKLKRDNIDGVILDLRDNGGGSLKEAIDLTGIFIDYGPILVVDGDMEKPFTYKDFNRGAIYNGPLIVMINENSASASEVVAGALQDYNRAVIVGQTSFGKATGQSVYPVAPDYIEPGGPAPTEWGFVKVTEIGLYRIDLTTNQFNGVHPDVEIEVPFEYDPFREKDYNDAIQLNPIEKKMYYTPLPETDLSSIASESKVRQISDSTFIKVKLHNDNMKALYENVDEHLLTLEEGIELWKSEWKLNKALDVVYDEMDISYTPESAKYDEEVYKMSEYLNLYREAFLDEIESDGELEEAYQILLELINK